MLAELESRRMLGSCERMPKYGLPDLCTNVLEIGKCCSLYFRRDEKGPLLFAESH